MGKRLYPEGFRDLYSEEYTVWSSMRARCNNPNRPEYANYGGKGIKVCPRWARFDFFVQDMGVRPGSEWSIERINSADDYRPENCYWARLIDQNGNKSNSLPLIERIHPRLRPAFRRTIEVIGFGEGDTWDSIADGWLPRHAKRPLY